MRIVTQDVPNWAQFLPKLNRVDLIRGAVDLSGPGDRDSFLAPDTRVVRAVATPRVAAA